MFGYALTMLFRNTVGALGLLLAVMMLGIVIAWTGFTGADRVMPWTNFVAFVIGGYTVYGSCSSVDCVPSEYVIDRVDALIYFAVAMAIVALPSLYLFKRRDLP